MYTLLEPYNLLLKVMYSLSLIPLFLFSIAYICLCNVIYDRKLQSLDIRFNDMKVSE
jgi:hypothetical protein